MVGIWWAAPGGLQCAEHTISQPRCHSSPLRNSYATRKWHCTQPRVTLCSKDSAGDQKTHLE